VDCDWRVEERAESRAYLGCGLTSQQRGPRPSKQSSVPREIQPDGLDMKLVWVIEKEVTEELVQHRVAKLGLDRGFDLDETVINNEIGVGAADVA
jgi:hypothetical protein